MRLGDDEQDYYRGGSAAVRRRPARARRHGTEPQTPAAGPLPRSAAPGEAVTFWVLGPSRRRGVRSGWSSPARPCTARCCSPSTMICLAVLYLAQDAPFLGVVQVVVYTGAVMMLFLFVLMLVGVDAGDSLVETIRGQRWPACCSALGFGAAARRRSRPGSASATPAAWPRPTPDGNVAGPRRPDLHPLRLRLRGHQRPADHRGARAPWCWRTASGTERRADPARAVASSGSVRRRRRQPGAAAGPGRLRPAQRRRHAGPAARRHARASSSVSRVLTARGDVRPRRRTVRASRRRPDAGRRASARSSPAGGRR